MNSTLAIQPAMFSSLAGIAPSAFQSIPTETVVTGASSSVSSSSIVQLSALGQVLASGFLLENSLDALQTNPVGATATSVQSKAQNFVAAFNSVQNTLGATTLLLATAPASSLIDQFSLSLDAAALTSATGEVPGIGNLQSIGISLQATASPGSAVTTLGLVVDQNVLNAAVTNNPEGTQALLTQAVQPLQQAVVLFEAQAAVPGTTPSDSIVPGIGAPANLVPNLTSDVVLTNAQVGSPGLANSGVSAVTDQTASAALLDASLISLLPQSVATTNLSTTVPVQPGPVVATSPLTVPTAAASTTLPQETAITTVPGSSIDTLLAAVNTGQPTSTAAGLAADASAADRTTAAATIALQILVDDPTQRAINNSLFDPVYSALMAASHQSDFAVPQIGARANAIPVDIPAPVLPVDRVHALGSYEEAARDFMRRQASGASR